MTGIEEIEEFFVESLFEMIETEVKKRRHERDRNNKSEAATGISVDTLRKQIKTGDQDRSKAIPARRTVPIENETY